MSALQEINEQVELLGIHRQNLGQLLAQESQFDPGLAPLHIVNGIKRTRKIIAEIKSNLWQYYSYKVESLPFDVAGKRTITMEVPENCVILVIPKDVFDKLDTFFSRFVVKVT